MHRLALFVLVLLSGTVFSVSCNGADVFPKILILNSYHKGYSWADQTVRSIESTMLLSFPTADIRVEYMDTKRKSSQEYLDILTLFYREKFKEQTFDLIFACDDHSIEFLQSYGESLFPDTPVVFSGANTLDASLTDQTVNPNMTGVLEFADISRTIELARQLQPGLKNIVVINDNTVTGKYISGRFATIMPELQSQFSVTFLGDDPLEELSEKIATLDNDTMVLLLSYFIDNTGDYYDPHYTASLLSEASAVPIYAVWDFYFNHGIIGGVMTSGYLQGETAAEIGKKILQGTPPADVPIVKDGANEILIDYQQLIRYGLLLENLPPEAIVKNITYIDQKEVLLLHSYSDDNPWTRNIMDGIVSSFANSPVPINTYTEYMDTKRHTDKPFLNAVLDLLKHKYQQRRLDLIITSDDNAFNMVRTLKDTLFTDTPVVFCGVNYLQNPQQVRGDNMTGVIESYDMLGTIELGLQLFPKTHSLYIVNDNTTTGKANKLRFENIRPQLPEDLKLTFSEDKSMQQVQSEVARLDENSLVLLMSFTMDKDNYRFSFSESAQLITRSSARPVLGFWDFYLGNGIIGGVITGGFDQGQTAGKLGIATLTGNPVSTLPVVETSPVIPTIDYNVAHHFGVDTDKLPNNVHILNRQLTFLEQYRTLIYPVLVIFGLLLLIVLIQATRIMRQHHNHNKLAVRVELDPLTGTKNREFFSSNIRRFVDIAIENKHSLILCYFDLDNLKTINDSYGHKAGDEYILLAVEAIRQQIRANDLLCRMGGDEFIALLPNCTLEKGAQICSLAEASLQTLSKTRHPDWETGLSCGFSELNPHQPLSPEELVEQADREMYRSKKIRKQQKQLNR